MPFDKARSFVSYLSDRLERKYNIGQKGKWINPNKKTIFSTVKIKFVSYQGNHNSKAITVSTNAQAFV